MRRGAPVVVLLHGHGRTHRSLARLRRRVEAAGYETWARSYPSRGRDLAGMAQLVEQRLRADLDGRELVAVTHSLGGVLVRLLAQRLAWRGVVMLAPPNRGSRLARALLPRHAFRRAFGPAAAELAHPLAWPAPPRPCAVIAGTAGTTWTNPTSWLAAALGVFPAGESHDGTVTVSETRLETEGEHVTVPASHTWIMNHPRTEALVLAFLATGRLGAG